MMPLPKIFAGKSVCQWFPFAITVIVGVRLAEIF